MENNNVQQATLEHFLSCVYGPTMGYMNVISQCVLTQNKPETSCPVLEFYGFLTLSIITCVGVEIKRLGLGVGGLKEQQKLNKEYQEPFIPLV